MSESLDSMNLETVKALESARIVQMRGLSGVSVSVNIASQCPGIVQMHCMSGNVYDFTFDGQYFHFEPHKIVYEVN